MLNIPPAGWTRHSVASLRFRLISESHSYYVSVHCHDCCVLEKLIQPDTVACAKLTGSSFTCSGRVPGPAPGRVQAGSGMPPGMLWEEGGSGGGGGPDALDGKREEWPIKVVLLPSPWRQGCAVTHLQESTNKIWKDSVMIKWKSRSSFRGMKEASLRSLTSNKGISTSSCTLHFMFSHNLKPNEACEHDKASTLGKHQNERTETWSWMFDCIFHLNRLNYARMTFLLFKLEFCQL